MSRLLGSDKGDTKDLRKNQRESLWDLNCCCSLRSDVSWVQVLVKHMFLPKALISFRSSSLRNLETHRNQRQDAIDVRAPPRAASKPPYPFLAHTKNVFQALHIPVVTIPANIYINPTSACNIQPSPTRMPSSAASPEKDITTTFLQTRDERCVYKSWNHQA